jgi:hypothetical protein
MVRTIRDDMSGSDGTSFVVRRFIADRTEIRPTYADESADYERDTIARDTHQIKRKRLKGDT